MATTEVCRGVIRTLGEHVHPMVAQLFVERFCERALISANDFNQSDVPHFILYLASHREDFDTVNDNKFQSLLASLVWFSNSGCEDDGRVMNGARQNGTLGVIG